MRFLIDANLPPALAQWIRNQGHEAEHVAAAIGPTATDRAIFAWAQERGAILVSKDRDFASLYASPDGPRLVLIRLGNATNRALIAALEQGWTQLESLLGGGGDRIVEWP